MFCFWVLYLVSAGLDQGIKWPLALALGSFSRWMYLVWPNIKSHKIPWVTFRSRCVMIMLNKLLIAHLKWNSLYSISHITETKYRRKSRWTLWNSVIRLFEIPKCDRENVLITLSDTMMLYVYSGNDKSHLAPDYERYNRSSAPTRSVRHYIKWFRTRISIVVQNE
jgi:hypothetical protein